jgi:transposase
MARAPCCLTWLSAARRWARGLLARAPKKVVIVALANKLARIAWAVLTCGGAYDPGRETAAA